MLTFESTQFQGSQAIVEKLTELPFKKIVHKVDTTDVQPAPGNLGLLIFVTGQLLVDEEQKPLFYAQTFQLMQENGSWYVHNDIFRLIYS